jgi:hypothetical protein
MTRAELAVQRQREHEATAVVVAADEVAVAEAAMAVGPEMAVLQLVVVIACIDRLN